MVLAKEWVRNTLAGLVTPVLGNGVFRQQLFAGAPWAGASLIRTIWDSEITLTVTAGTNPIPDFGWPSGYLEVRAIWSHDGSAPAVVLDARTRQDLGRVLLRPRYLASPAESIKYVISYSPLAVQDVQAQRKAAAEETPGVYLYTYWHDASNSLPGSYDEVLTLNMQLETLWGH